MSLTTTTPKVTQATDGTTLAFSFSFKMWQASVESEIAVIFQEGESDEAALALTTDYTLSAPNNDYSTGGTVTLVAGSAYAEDGKTITIKSDITRSQTYQLEVGGSINAITLETVLDRYVRMIQEAELNGTIEQTAISSFYITQLVKASAEAARIALLIYPVIVCVDNAVVCIDNEVVTVV